MKIKKQIHKTKSSSYTDQLAECKTWEEVMSLKNTEEDYWKAKAIYASNDWLLSFSNEDAMWAEENYEKSIYDDLLDEIDKLLEEEDATIFLLTYQGNGSLRWVASKIGKSHEFTRKRLKEIKLILKNNLPDRFRTFLQGSHNAENSTECEDP